MPAGVVYPDTIDYELVVCGVGIGVQGKSFCFCHKGIQISLVARPHVSIRSNDIVIPSWALSALKLSPGQTCEYRTISMGLLPPNAFVELSFVACQSKWQWTDIIPSQNSIETPLSWRSEWPDGVNTEVLTSMLPSLLQGAVFTDDSYLAVKVFDLVMIFRVALSDISSSDGTTCDSVEWNASIQFRIRTSSSTEEPNSSTIASSPTSYTSQYICYPSVMSRLLTSYHESVSPSVAEYDQRFLTKSHLLCAPEGAGKSYLLSQFLKQIQQSHPSSSSSSSSGVLCLTSSCSVLTPSSTASTLNTLSDLMVTDQTMSMEDTSVTAQRRILAYVRVLMKALAVPDSLQAAVVQKWCGSSEITAIQSRTIVWIIDDLDQVLKQYANNLDSADDNNEDSGTATVQLGNEYQIVGYLLHHLLKLLAEYGSSPTQNVYLLIMGACRLDVRQVPRSHTGAPEFEKVLSLPRVNRDSRQAVLTSLLINLINSSSSSESSASMTLGALPSSLLPEPDAIASDAVTCWSHRLAELTAGYCPGDLVALVNHAALVHRGKAGMLNNNGNTASKAVARCLEWDTVMQAMLSLPPKQLQSLGIESSGSGSNVRNQKLSWSDFAGYTETITLLKRLLTPRLPTSSSSAATNLEPGEVIIPSSTGVSDFSSRLSAVPKGIVLHGPSGCGKSLLARIIASEAKMNFVSIRSTEILSKYFGQTESAIRSLFQKARSAAPCVLFFDEFDAIAYKRGADDEAGNGLHGRVLSTFLNELDGVTSAGSDRGFENSVMVLAACADVSALDEALVRPGRLQYHILLDKPTCEDVQNIIRNEIRTMPVDESVNVLHTATLLMTMRPSCADAEALCQKALFGAIREHIHQSNDSAEASSGIAVADRKVTQSHFNQALSELTGMSLDVVAGMKPREAVFQWSGAFNVSL